jgi:hypothetical protein
VKALLHAVLCAVCALMLALPAGAQLDPGNFEIFQNGRKVGEIFVPERTKGQTSYVEHWVLSSDYIYPGGKLSAQILIKRSQRSYASVDDFFARVSWGSGYRYVKIEATDADKLPNRAPQQGVIPGDRDKPEAAKKVRPAATNAADPDKPARRAGKSDGQPPEPDMPAWARELLSRDPGGGGGGGGGGR